MWEKKQQKPQIEGRQSHLSTAIGGKYILIYGGMNQQEKLLTDFYIYNIEDFTWRKVQKLRGNLEVKVGGSLTIINNQIYIFGGQINDQNQYSNQIYKLKIINLEQKDNFQTQIEIFKLSINGIKPQPRTCHAATPYKERYIIILGGQTHPKPPSELSTLLNDVWVFDVQKNQWEQLKIQNQNLLKPRSNFTATVYKENLIIFGGLVSIKDYRSSDQMFLLTLNTGQNKLTCNLCKTTYKQISRPRAQLSKQIGVSAQNKFYTGISNILKISSSIKHPFQCFGLFLYSLQLLQIQSCKIQLIQQNLTFQIQNFFLDNDEWNHIRSIYQFNPLFISSDQRLNNALKTQIRRNYVNFFAYNLKNICFRLGNSFLLSWAKNGQIKIVLVNKFGIFQATNPEGEKSNLASHTSIILQYIKQQSINLMGLFQHSFSVHISSLKKMIGVNELKYDKKSCDIYSWKQQKLRTYLQIYLEAGFSIELFLNQNKYRFQKKKGNLIHIQIEKIHIENQFPNVFSKILYYCSDSPSSIYIYQNQRLLHQKKTKFRFSYDFHIHQSFQTNITFTDIQPTQEIVHSIKKIVQKNQQQIKKRKQPEKGFEQYVQILKGKSLKIRKNGNEATRIKKLAENQIDIQKATLKQEE